MARGRSRRRPWTSCERSTRAIDSRRMAARRSRIAGRGSPSRRWKRSSSIPDSYYLIEIKQTDPPIVEGLLAAIEDHAALERVVIASGDLDTIVAVRAAAPEAFTSLSTPEVLDLYINVGSPEYVAPAQFVHSPWDLTSAELVAFAHELGMKVHPWTVNEEARMADLIGRGVDGIMTDDPALLETVAP
ncbi:glycerophosphodiester phosphodiesterase family protein [Nannocystis pusilla]|uniref:glycerophosphodiester phosphodiesterase family protein n=1 Tax=Nannocystis pusilla TaxID=889268 RepID=UPI003B77C06A